MEPVTRNSYANMPTPNKLEVLFDITMELYKCSCATQEKVDELEKKFDKRKKFDTSVAGASGFLGGFISVIVGKFLK